MKESIKHESEEGEPVETGDGLWQSLVVSGKSAEARSPCKGVFNNPSARQGYESAFSLLEFYHNQLNPIGGCHFLSVIPLVDKSHFGMFPGGPLNICSKIGHLRSLLLIGRSDLQREKISKCVNRRFQLLTPGERPGGLKVIPYQTPSLMAITDGSRESL